MSFLGRRRKPVIIDAHRTFSADCWYCRGRLPSSFTTVETKAEPHKPAQTVRVHYGCRRDAEDLIAGKWIQDNEDYELETRPIG